MAIYRKVTTYFEEFGEYNVASPITVGDPLVDLLPSLFIGYRGTS